MKLHFQLIITILKKKKKRGRERERTLGERSYPMALVPTPDNNNSGWFLWVAYTNTKIFTKLIKIIKIKKKQSKTIWRGKQWSYNLRARGVTPKGEFPIRVRDGNVMELVGRTYRRLIPNLHGRLSCHVTGERSQTKRRRRTRRQSPAKRGSAWKHKVRAKR